MFEQVFKRIDDILWKDAGCGSELDYVQQTSWILFLKYLEDFEKEKIISAELSGKPYKRIISKEFSWETWAVPKDEKGEFDHNNALTGDDLREFVNMKLFPYLKKFKSSAESPDTIEYKIGEIFGELRNKIIHYKEKNNISISIKKSKDCRDLISETIKFLSNKLK